MATGVRPSVPLGPLAPLIPPAVPTNSLRLRVANCQQRPKSAEPTGVSLANANGCSEIRGGEPNVITSHALSSGT